jgi:sugar/nucleoside kinase (ribokinase family)
MKNGITVAGTIVVDTVKMIAVYPQKSMLVNVSSLRRSVGGCVPNTASDLVALGVPVSAVGRVGSDEAGAFVTEEMRRSGVDISGVLVTPGQSTSFTDVMTAEGTGERTFFNMRGASGLFCIEDIDVNALDCRIFHVGYLMLLDKMDEIDTEYGTRLARLLCAVQKRGIKTSIDVVSDTSDRFAMVVTPALKYCDYAVLNEIEAGFVTGIEPRGKDGKLMEGNIRRILERFIALGVKKAVIHCPEKGFCVDRTSGYTAVPSLKLPEGYLKGAVGAGDAFCAGMLYSFYNGFSDKESLTLAACTAAANLSVPDSVSGARNYQETIMLAATYPPQGE